MKQRIKQLTQKARSIACDDDVWTKCADIARERKLTVSAYIRSLIEDDIKQRQEALRIGHTQEVVKLHFDRRVGIH